MSNFIKQWTQNEVDALNRTFRRHSVLVFILKFILPITALVMAVGLFLYPTLAKNEKRIVLVAQDAPKTNTPTGSPVMVNPRYQGFDSKNQQYQVSAKRATQLDVQVVELTELSADITLNDGKWLSLVSKTGVYDMKAKYVDLYGDVNVFMTDSDSNSFHMETEEGYVNLQNGEMSSNKPVTVTSSIGKFSSGGFVMNRDEQKITFKGPVKLVILKK